MESASPRYEWTGSTLQASMHGKYAILIDGGFIKKDGARVIQWVGQANGG